MYKLIFDKGSLSGRTLELADRRVLFGRDVDCQVRLSDDAVSRHHCCIEEGDDGWYLVDLGAINGVFVNGQKVMRHKLASGDRIRIGPTEGAFESIAPPRTSTVPEKKMAGTREMPLPTRQFPVVRPRSSSATLVITAFLALTVGVLIYWTWKLERQVRALQPSGETAAQIRIEKLQSEVDALREQLRQRAPVPQESPAATPEPPQPPRQPPSGAAIPPSRMPQKLRFVQTLTVEKIPADETSDERVQISVKARAESGENTFDPSQARIAVTFCEIVDGRDVEESKAVAASFAPAPKDWAEFSTQTLDVSYVAPKGARAKEKAETGRSRSFYGCVVRAYYRGELQDVVAFPNDFPTQVLMKLTATPPAGG